MSGITVRRRVPFAEKLPTASSSPERSPDQRPVSRVARQLALAHHVEHLVNTGAVTDYAAAARALGLTRARVTQVLGLLLLSPEIQEALLLGDLRQSEHGLRCVAAEPEWLRQSQLVTTTGSRT